MPVRAARSKTGCQACRRRKVRCDEHKPVCGACMRLQLPCFFRPGTGPAVETPRYRVRFVHSPYSLGGNGGDQNRHDTSNSPLRSAAAAPISSLLSGLSGRPDGPIPLQPPRPDAAPTSAELLDRESAQHQHHNQVLPMTPDLVTPRPALSVHHPQQQQPQQAQQTYEGQPLPAPAPAMHTAGAGADPQSYAGHVPTFFDLNMHFDLLNDSWLAMDPSADPSAPEMTAAAYTNAPGVHLMLAAAPATCSSSSPALTSTPASASTSPFPSPRSPISAPAPAPATLQASVIIAADDHVLIQHYHNVMSQYTKIRSPGDENIYTQIFNNMAPFYAPLYNAIMAWTGLHLGQRQAESQEQRLPEEQPQDLSPQAVQPESKSVCLHQAERRYAHAVSLLHDDQDVAYHFELSLVTIWFCLQFELLAARGIGSFCRHLEFTADLVDAHRRHHRAGGAAVALSPVGARVLVWLGTYDARATWIGGSGRLLQILELFAYEHDFLAAAFPAAADSTENRSRQASRSASLAASDEVGEGGGERVDGGQAGKTGGSGTQRRVPSPSPSSLSTLPPPSSPELPYSSSSLQTCLRLTMQFDAVDNRIAQLHQRPVPAPAAIWLALQSDLITAQKSLENRPAVAPILGAMFGSDTHTHTHTHNHNRAVRLPSKITTDQFNDLLLLSACYTGIIGFHRVLPPAVARDKAPQLRGLLDPQVAAARVLRIAAWVCRLRPPSPQNVWPRILFLAGIETADPVYQDWAVRTLTEAELWGGNMAKTRALLQHIIHRQTQEGARVDILDAMRQTTGLFII